LENLCIDSTPIQELCSAVRCGDLEMSYFNDSAAVFYSFGFFTGMVCMELLLEYVSTFQDKFQLQGSLPSLVTLSQFFACFLLPWILSPRDNVRITFYKNRANILTYGLITMLVFGATALATASLLYVSYPMKIVFKSSKLIPTMIVSIFFFNKTYSLLDYCSAVMLCLGTTLFVYDPTKTDTSPPLVLFSPGVGLLLAAVTCDAFLPNIQKKMMSTVSPEELMVNSNLMGTMVLLLSMIFSGAFHDLIGVLLDSNHSFLLAGSLAGIGICLSVAVLCYTHLIKEAGPIVAVGVATLRKVITLVLSYTVFPKPLRWMEIGALCLIGGGVGLESWKRSCTPHAK